MNRKGTTKRRRHQEPLNGDAVHVVVCPLGGVDCYLWFDEDGELHGKGPKEARRKLESLLYRYTPLMKKKEAIEAVSDLTRIGPEHLWITQCAVRSLMLEAEARGDRPEDAALAQELIESRIAKIRELPALS
jgi:hypothetical protein